MLVLLVPPDQLRLISRKASVLAKEAEIEDILTRDAINTENIREHRNVIEDIDKEAELLHLKQKISTEKK